LSADQGEGQVLLRSPF